MRVLTCAPSDDLRRLRHLVSAAIERLRTTLQLPPGDPATAGEVACAALSALSTVLFVGGDNAGPRVPTGLVEDQLRQITGLLGLPFEAAAAPAGAVLPGNLPPEPTSVAP